MSDATTSLRSPVFVVGMPRSGTTLLSRLLDAHPDLAMAPETHYFTRCWTGEAVTARADVRRLLDRLMQQPGVQDMTLTDEERARIRRRIDSLERPALGSALQAVVEAFAARSGASAWGEKTPDHLRAVPTMARAFPGAAFIAIVRDPRDVILSLRSVPWSRTTLLEQAWTWRTYAARIARYRATLADRFTMVRYEDLIATPERAMRTLFAFLGTDAPPPIRAGTARTGVADPDREPWKRKSMQPIDASNREKWRTQMEEAERVIIEALAGRYLAQYGYDRPPVRWRPALVGRVLGRLLRAGRRWVERRLQQRPGARDPDDARPRWMDDETPNSAPS